MTDPIWDLIEDTTEVSHSRDLIGENRSSSILQQKRGRYPPEWSDLPRFPYIVCKLMQCDCVLRLECLLRCKTVHPILITIISSIFSSVATAIPWFDTDEWSILCRRWPYADNRGIKRQAEPRCAVCTMESDLANLRILHHDGIYLIECFLSDWQKAVCWTFKRIFCLKD